MFENFQIIVKAWNEATRQFEPAWESMRTPFASLDRNVIRQYGFEVTDITVYPALQQVIVFARRTEVKL
jgi:hypothetical protein